MVKFVILLYSLLCTAFTSLFNIGTVVVNEIEYEMNVGSQMKIDYTIIGEVEDLGFSSSNSNVIMVDNNGLMHAIKAGSVTIRLFYNDKEVEVFVEAYNKYTLDEVNMVNNVYLYSMLNSEISTYMYDNSFKNGEVANIEMKLRSSVFSTSESLQMKTRNNYVEIIDNNQTTVYYKKKDNIESFTLDENDNVINETSYPLDYDEIDFDSSYSVYGIDLSKSHIEKHGNAYYISMYYKDALTIEAMNELAKMYNELGLSTNDLFSSIIYIRIEVNADSINIDFSMNCNMQVLMFSYPIFVSINMDVSKENVKKIKLDSNDEEEKKPQTKNELNLEEMVEIVATEKYEIELEPGQYLVTSDDSSVMEKVSIYLYGENNEKIDINENLKISKYLYNIKASGTYYFEFINRDNNPINLKVTKLSYNTLYDESRGNKLQTATGTIEGPGDIDYYKLHSAVGDIFKFTNNGSTTITLYTNMLNYDNYNYDKINLKPNEYIIYEFNKSSDMYICCDDFFNGQKYEYSFEVESFNHGNTNAPVNISTDFSEKYYVLSKNLNAQKFKIKLDERKMVDLEFEYLEEGMSFPFIIQDTSGNLISKYNNKYILDKGEYYIVLDKVNMKRLSIAKVKLVTKEVPDDLIGCNRPSGFDHNIDFTELDEEIVLNDYKGYVKYELEAGQYYFDCENIVGWYDLYDDKLNKIEIVKYNMTNFENTFIIDEAGVYYIYFYSLYNTASLKECGYNTYFNDTIELKDSNSGTIEGAYDIDTYTYNLSLNSIYELTNTGNKTLYIYYVERPFHDSDETYKYIYYRTEIKKNESVYFCGGPHTMKLFVATNNLKENISYEYSFTVKELDTTLGSDLNNLETISYDFSLNEYVCGFHIPNRYAKIVIEELGVYTIESNPINNTSKFNFALYNEEGSKINNYTYNNDYLLYPGTYKVELSALDMISYGKIKLAKCSGYNIVNLILDELTDDSNLENVFTVNQINEEGKLTYYCFSISEDSELILNRFYHLFNDKGHNNFDDEIENEFSYYKLVKGYYYFVIPEYEQDNYVEAGILKNN